MGGSRQTPAARWVCTHSRLSWALSSVLAPRLADALLPQLPGQVVRTAGHGDPRAAQEGGSSLSLDLPCPISVQLGMRCAPTICDVRR